MIALLVAAGLCASVTDIAHSGPAGFERVRGAKHSGKTWTDPVKLPGAKQCRVIDDAPPFYVCEMSCEAPFEASVRELSTCLGEPHVSDDGKKKTARFSWHHIPIRLTSSSGKTCDSRLFIEPLK